VPKLRKLDIDLAALDSILIVKPSSLGDIVHTLPLLSLLRHHAPKAKITWLVNSVWAPLLQEHPFLDEIVEYPRQKFRGIAAPFRFRRWARLQRDLRPDLAIDVQGLLRSAIATRACRPRQIVGYSDAREGANFLHHQVIDVDLKRSPHAVDRYLTFFQAFGLEIPENPDFPLPDGEPIDQQLPADFVLLHPFSRGKGKSLTNSQVQEFCRSLGDQPVVLVGKTETEDARLDLPANAVDLLNLTSLAQLIWILRRAAFVVSVDSGPMHLAAAVTGRLLSIHTWTDPLKVGPYRPEAWVWKSNEIRTIGDHRISGSPDQEAVQFTDAAVAPLVAFIRQQLLG
jgi:heptosyltransferase-1